MAKVIFEFDYFEDRELIEDHQKAVDMSSSLDDIYCKIRNEFKHGSIQMSDEIVRFLEEIQDMTRNLS